MKTAIFEIFRTGKHNGSGENGKRRWNNDDLAKTALMYNEKIKTAPLVIGHPVDDRPQYGNVKRLIHRDGALFAETEVQESLIDKIKQGLFSGISVSFYALKSDSNPIKDLAFYLKHVGFLEKGKNTPAVKGMLDPRTSAELAYSELTGVSYFCEDEPLDYAEHLHKKAVYFQQTLEIDYPTALHIAEQ